MTRRLVAVLAVFVAGAIALIGLMVWLAGAAPVQRNLTVELSGLPPRTRPIKLVLLADAHVARFGDTPERLEQTVSRVNALHPDIVLLGGDFMADHGVGRLGMRSAYLPLAKLKAPLGVFAILGNHDYAFQAAPAVARWLRRAGIAVLDNSAAGAGPLTIVGIGDAFTHHDNVPAALAAARHQGDVPIVLTHSPDAIPDLPPEIQLAFAGHTHCGQVVLPFVGALDTRSRYGQRYVCGVVREGSRTAVMTSGLGVSRVPFRLGAPPDFWVITIIPRKR